MTAAAVKKRRIPGLPGRDLNAAPTPPQQRERWGGIMACASGAGGARQRRFVGGADLSGLRRVGCMRGCDGRAVRGDEMRFGTREHRKQPGHAARQTRQPAADEIADALAQ